MRRAGAHPFENEITRNPYVWGALLLCLALILAAVYAPPLASVLKLDAPDAATWGVIIGASAAPLLLGQIALSAVHAFAPSSPQRD